jgi:ACT domain-containing protein
MSTKDRAVVTVIGKDKVGILANVVTCCAEANANVINVTQSVLDDFFTMNMLIDLALVKIPISELEANIKAKEPEMEVHVMHESIFDSMHTI